MSTEYGLQLFSVRDITGNDLEGALREVAAMGYRYVEYAGFFGHPAETVAAWQEKYGLACSGTHTGWGELLPETSRQPSPTIRQSGTDISSSPAQIWIPWRKSSTSAQS